MRFALAAVILSLIATSASARESLGVFSDWGAFRDAEVPRCYAIAAAQTSRSARDVDPFASIGTWPERQVRGQPSFRLSRQMSDTPNIRLTIAGRSFNLEGSGVNAWAANAQDDAAIVAAMRSANTMQISASDQRARRFTDRYSLDGAATAMDAASVGCARS